MSDITRPHEASRLDDGCERLFLCERAETPAGGARRDRTDDLLLAKQALSQLSYGPPDAGALPGAARHLCGLVGLGRLERPTSPLSGVRSNHLSYRPAATRLHRRT